MLARIRTFVVSEVNKKVRRVESRAATRLSILRTGYVVQRSSLNILVISA